MSDAARSGFFEFADQYVVESSVLSPIAATRRGIDEYDDRLDDFSPDRFGAEAELIRSSLAELRRIEPADDIDRIGIAMMGERLATKLALAESGENRRMFSILWSPASDVRRVFELQHAETPEHARRLRARLEAVPQAYSSWRTTLDEDSRAGRVPSRRQSLGVAAQLETYSKGAFGALARRLAASCGVDAESSGMLEAAARAEQAAGELARWLREVHAPRSASEDGVGAERYVPWAANYLGATADFAELYEWGWEDLRRINERMWEIGKEVAPDATSLMQIAEALDTDESRLLVGTDALLEALRGLVQSATTMLEGRHFDIDDRIRRCDVRIAPEGSAGAAYYTGPSEDLSRPGITWFPTLGHDRFPLWREVSTWYHESIPGHHLQVATSVIERGRLSRYQRVEGFVSGYGEGWALYAERLMEELGAFSDPGDEMGYLSSQALRAARVVVDIGMHQHLPVPDDLHELTGIGDVRGRAWDAAMSVALLEERAMLEHDKAVSEVDRYLGGPAQAISYKVGERTWLRCREEARQRLGERFDLKAWHAYALAIGPMGLDPFEREVAAFGG